MTGWRVRGGGLRVDVPFECADTYQEAAKAALARHLEYREGEPICAPLNLREEIVVAKIDGGEILGVSIMEATFEPDPRHKEALEYADVRLVAGFRTVERWTARGGGVQSTRLDDLAVRGRHLHVVDTHPNGRPARVDRMYGAN